MRIGLTTDSLGTLPFDELLETAANLGIQTLEFGCGGWSSAPHVNLNTLLENEAERADFLAKIRAHGLEISALNCSGNQLAPGERGKTYDQVVRGTLKLAGLLGVRRVVMMSGLPGGPGDQNANWITTAWPPEVHEILRYQWEDVALPYWRDLAKQAHANGVEKICIEQQAHQLG
jgi:sugar phosphate isomerase/epimerase